MAWDLSPGDELSRREVHELVGGGSRQNGMTRVRYSDNLLLFSSSAGTRYGYNFDDWKSDGAFHYTGEGQLEDQVFTRGNLQLRDHEQLGLRPRLFREAGRSRVRYVGEFRVDTDHPWYPEEASDRLGDLRKVIVFRLLPVNAEEPTSSNVAPAATKPSVRDVPMEAYQAETFQTEPRREPTIAERREADLVRRYTAWLEATGSTVTRKEIRLPHLGHALYTDLYDGGRFELVEAKSTAARHHVRLALGQVLDYARHVEHQSRAVLLPSDPGPDLVDLLRSVNIACVYEATAGTFIRIEP
ncbi:hypothetical protein [Couchioplanes caeruleus]|uniref:ScoMcrA-like SRA domain-containing protein n=2 Tax=Couchioplanes caeruleus TaxID=56438 RepID=A0A1K0FYT9_9ACTN|nr:hypothetical protein [Couchioplanes caeruleus]OJF10218.1 hypothetical protein BG844_33195 [Couchioplanes caeruleus subsp. caeruleus]